MQHTAKHPLVNPLFPNTWFALPPNANGAEAARGKIHVTGLSK
jgi:hypothetical protein